MPNAHDDLAWGYYDSLTRPQPWKLCKAKIVAFLEADATTLKIVVVALLQAIEMALI